jgi:hypothetical protein
MKKTPEEIQQRYELVLRLYPDHTFAEIGRILGIHGTTARYIYQRAHAAKSRKHGWNDYMERRPLQPTELRLLAGNSYIVAMAKHIGELESC